jgi:predicted cupin superfamily sugar epimerase
MERDAAYWVEQLRLRRHPEGGYYRESYRSRGWVPHAVLGGRHAGDRAYSTAIYYLLPADEVSRLHRLRSDELFHYYRGAALTVHLIDLQGVYDRVRLGPDIELGETLQADIPAGYWFGATVDVSEGFSLVGCTVAPGFDFADFEQAERTQLLAKFPELREIIERLTA